MLKIFEIVQHTADLRIRVIGKDLKALFKNAIYALAFILNSAEAKKEAKRTKLAPLSEKIKIEAADCNILLVDFLNEVLSRSQINKAIYPQVKIEDLSGTRISAVIRGRAVLKFQEDIKAVTYYEVGIVKNKKGVLETILVFDI